MHLFIIFVQLYKGSSVFGEARCRVQRLPSTTSLTTSITTITQEPRPLTTDSGPAPSSTYYITNQVTDEKDEFGDKSSLILIIQYISMLSNLDNGSELIDWLFGVLRRICSFLTV